MSKALSLFLIAAAMAAGCKDGKTPSSSPDAVPFSELAWTWGRFDGSKAVLDAPRISGLAVAGTAHLTFKWDVDMAAWGYADGDPKGVACLFIKRDGKWVGGKFEWVSSSRTFRGMENIRAGYAGWDVKAVGAADSFAYVVVSKDGRKRSNVAAWRQ